VVEVYPMVVAPLISYFHFRQTRREGTIISFKGKFFPVKWQFQSRLEFSPAVECLNPIYTNRYWPIAITNLWLHNAHALIIIHLASYWYNLPIPILPRKCIIGPITIIGTSLP